MNLRTLLPVVGTAFALQVSACVPSGAPTDGGSNDSGSPEERPGYCGGEATLDRRDGGAVLLGTCTFDSPQDVTDFNAAHIAEVRGFLRIHDVGRDDVILDDLQFVERFIVFDGVQARHFSFPSLTKAGAIMVLDARWVQRFSFDQLVSLTERMYVTGICFPVEISLPNLVSISGDLEAVQTVGVQNLDFPMLDSVGGSVNISENLDLFSVLAPRLRVVGGDFSVFYNPLLPECVPNGLVMGIDVGGSTEIYSNSVDAGCPP